MRSAVEAKLEQLRKEIEGCRECPLADTSPRIVFGEGNPCSPMVVVGEGPGEREELEGRPFVGRAGDLLNKLLVSAGLRRDDLWITNVLKRRAVRLINGRASNRPPTAHEVAVYKRYLERELQVISPRIVLCLGNVAANALVHRNFQMSRDHGVWFTSPEGRKLMATFHPAYILRLKGGRREELLRQAMEDFAVAAEEYRALRGQAGRQHPYDADAGARHDERRDVTMDLDFVRGLLKPAESKIVLLVMDGLGGLPKEPGGPTELEAASTPNLDTLAAQGICGLHQPVGFGVTPGSGPAHLALFGYDPIRFQIGRGVLEALGVGFDLSPQDVAARGNFCTVDEAGRVTDRRAGRISTEKNRELCTLLRQIRLPDVELFVEPVKEHRFLVVLRGEGLSAEVSDTDPQEVGQMPLEPEALSTEGERTARLIKQFAAEARRVLAGHAPANMVLLRGFSKRPSWPSVRDVFGLRAAAIAAYPMYRGVAKLVGMEVLDTGERLDDEFDVLERRWRDFDFFYLHVKRTDSFGEDGDYDRKAALIAEVDAQLPRLVSLEPDVVIVTGDHSTPSVLRSHSWHPVPVLLWSRHCRPDGVDRFGERACVAGSLGARIPSVELMPLALANAMRLEKFGA